MNKGLIAILAGALLLTVTVPARPGRAQENPRNECKGIHAQLEREHARLKAELARMTAELKRLRDAVRPVQLVEIDRKSRRLNSSHGYISYAVFCLKKKKNKHKMK